MADRRVEQRLYRPTEAAESLGVSRSSMYLWIQQGLVRTVRVGSRSRVPASELDRLAEEGVPQRATS
jgi:excisionase family DNA binding protein